MLENSDNMEGCTTPPHHELSRIQRQVLGALHSIPHPDAAAFKVEQRLENKLAALDACVGTIWDYVALEEVDADAGDLKALSLLALAQRGQDVNHSLRFLGVSSARTRRNLAAHISALSGKLRLQGVELPMVGLRRSAPSAAQAGSTFNVYMLSPGERLIVDGMRAWVMALKRDEAPFPATQAQFSCVRVRPGALSLNDILLATATSSTRRVEIRCEGVPSISFDEARVVASVEACQHDRVHEARFHLASWLASSTLPMALKGTVNLSDTLSRAGLNLPAREWTF